VRFGRFFEDFIVGEIIKHWPGRTITEADNTWFSLLTQNQHPLHIDDHYAQSSTHYGRRVVNGTLVFAIAVGQTVADISGRAIANLDYESIMHHAPTFHGDTIYTESTTLDVSRSSKMDRGVIRVETRVTNQQGTLVMTFRRHVLVAMRSHATLGAETLRD
jgi:acyl dehydratase